MTEPGNLVSPDDTGSDTFARFKYQAHVTFPYFLRLARGERITDVFAEHVEDIAVREGEAWRFLQVKSRDAGRGPWTFAEVVRSGAFHSLWRAYRAAGPSVAATYEVCLEGAVKNDDVLSAVVDSGELDDDCLQRLANGLGAAVEQVGDFAARLIVRPLPPLGAIVPNNIRVLGSAAPTLSVNEIERTYEAAMAAIEAAMTGDRLEGEWPGALFLAPDERSQQRLEAKRITRERAAQIFAPILRAAAEAHTVVQARRAPRVVLPLTNVQAFTGRSVELQQLESLLLHSQGEKVSSIAGVSGSGGIGKSALACRFAELHQDEFPDGVVGLRVDGREPISIARDFAARAGVEIDSDDDRDASTVMQEVFRERRALLIFDNADDVAIRGLLPGGTRCAVIITTRDRGLAVALGVPEPARLDLSPLPPTEALELLERLAGARVRADAAAARRICALAGDLPLALQIAGATLQVQPWRALEDYAAALAEERKRLALLAFEDLDVRVSFSLSLLLLDSTGIDFFVSLAVCAQDGFSLMGAAAANGCDEATAQDRLTQLYRLSLVNSGSGDTARFVLHPLLRLFAREKAEERGVFAVADLQHREFYAALVKTKTRDIAEAEAAALLVREVDDIVAAAQATARHGVVDYDFVLRIGSAFESLGQWHKLSPVFSAFVDLARRSSQWSAAVQFELQRAKFLTLRGRFADAEQHLVVVEGVISRVEPEDARRRATAMWLNSLGGVLQRLGRFDDAVSAFEKSAAIEEQLDNPRGQAKVLNSLGGVLQRKGAFDRAAAMFRRSAAIERESGTPHGEAMALNSLGGVLRRQGNSEGAVDAFRTSEELLTALGDFRGQAMVLTSLGGVLQHQGELAGAAEVLKRGAAIEARLGNERGQAMVLTSLGGVLQRQGKFEEAVDAFRRSYELEKNLGNPRGHAMVLNSLGGVLQRQGKFEEAVDAFRRSYAISADLDDRRSVAMVLNSLGGVLQRQGKFEEAVDAFRRSVAIGKALGDVRHLAMVLNSLGGVLQRQGKFEEAVDAFRRSYAISADLDDRRSVAMVLNSLGGVLQRQGKFDEAVDAFRDSHTISEGLNDRHMVAMVLNSLGGVLQRQGKFDEAVDALRRSHELLVELGDSRGQAMVLNSFGGVLQRQGKFEEAVDAFRRSYAISADLGDQRSVPMVLNSLGGVLQRQGKFDEAVDAFRDSHTISEGLNDRHMVAMVLNSLGGVLQRQGKFDEAVDALRRSHELLVELGDSRGQAMVLNSLGGVLQRQRKRDEAYAAFRASIAIGEKLDDRRHLAMVHTAYGRALLSSNRQAAVRELRAGFEFDAALRNRRGVGIIAPILVETLMKMGQTLEALEICEQALAIKPGDQRLLRLKDDLERGKPRL